MGQTVEITVNKLLKNPRFLDIFRICYKYSLYARLNPKKGFYGLKGDFQSGFKVHYFGRFSGTMK